MAERMGTVIPVRLRTDMESRVREIAESEANTRSAVVRRLVAAGLKATGDRTAPAEATAAAEGRGE